MVDIKSLLIRFVDQAKTDNLKTSSYPKNFEDLKINVSFGQGYPARIPWISLTIDPNTTSNGIYPVYLYYKSIKKIILAYGISETNKPTSNWNIDKPKTIIEFFSENGYETPQRYGKSFVFKSYDIDQLEGQNIVDDLNEIIEIYRISLKLEKSESYKNVLVSDLKIDLDNSGLSFQSGIVDRFKSSLLTKPFVILTGLSGSGKTKLAQAFAMWMSESKDQYAIVPVGADWTNREPLLGYPNSLKKRHYVKPDSGVLDILLRAHEDYTKHNGDLALCKPYFLILDEMNLSHVERYFADFLSAMESGDEIKLYAGEDRSWEVDERVNKEGDFMPACKVEPKVKMPKNLFIIGTVNIDETTYMFSPKVLDRANTIEFRVTKEEMKKFFENHSPLDMNQLLEDVEKNIGKGVGASKDFMSLAKGEGVKMVRAKHLDTFTSFFQQLQQAGAEFGYRTANEMIELIGYLNYFGVNDEAAYDVAIMQKLLPKLHGSRSKLSKILPSLGALCLKSQKKEGADKFFDEYKSNQAVLTEKAKEIKFPLSFEKICRMNKNAQDNGFASYAEA